MTLPKVNNWAHQVQQHLRSLNGKDHAWCEADCWAMVNGAFKAQTGKELAKGVSYKTEAGGLKLLKKQGADTMLKFLQSHEHLKRIHVSQATLGDLGVVKVDGVWTGVVCDGVQWCGMGLSGLQFLPRGAVRSVFRV